VAFVGAAFVWPLARLCALAFSTGSEAAPGIVRLFGDGYDQRALFRSLWFSSLIAAASVIVCLPAALALARGRFRGRALLRAVFAVPLSLSGVVVGFLAVAMLGNAGALPSLLRIEALRGSAFGAGGLAAAYLWFEVPRATLTMEAALAAVDEGLLEAARTLGARPWQVARWVFWPLCAPAVRAAFGVTFAASLGSFGVALVLAARFPLLPVELYRAFTGTLDDPLAAAMALVLAVAAVAVLALTRGRDR
jgi:putative spermidine/putrescine transport system permease protein